jgi:OOP family OmpA-OmpF porin
MTIKMKTRRFQMKKIFLMAPVIRIMALVLFAFVFLLPLSAHSQIKEGSFEVSPFVGYNFFEQDQNLKNSIVYGGRLGYNFTKHFGLEVSMDFINTSVDDQSKTGKLEGEFTSPIDKVDSYFYHIDGVYHFMPDSKFTPFVVAGFGGTHYSPAISNKDMFTFDLGVGAKYWLADNIAIRLDLRDNMVGEVFAETYHNINATVGITFAFGGKAKPAVAKYEAKPEPEPVTEAKPAPKAEEPVIFLVSEPKVEEKVAVLASEPKVEEKVIILAFEDIHFDFDKSTLTNEAKVILKRNIQLLKQNPKAQIRIAGYTSASGTEAYNQKLSERRANAVKAYLVNEGVVASDRLITIGYGKTKPAMYEAAPKEIYSKAAKANMRVLFEIVVK